MQFEATNLTIMPIHNRPESNALLLSSILWLCSLMAPAVAGESMPTFSANYVVENDFVTGGKAKLRLTKKEDHFQLLLETKPTGVFRLSKKGKIREIAELPSLSPPFLSEKYSYTNFGDKKRSFTSVFNRSKSEATFVRNAKTTNVAIDAYAVDKLSMMLSMMEQIRKQPDIEKFSIDTIDNDGTQTYHFISQGQESLKTDLGNLTATRIDRQRQNSSRKTVTWLALMGPDALPVPVQLEHYKRGKLTARLKITKFSILE